ncbi:Chromosome transmission fidelity protein 18 [Colletotrichum chlorophyti]|uniref:Chromosome transmission fidelity protein 18 n=1 Tax=Colletotrichum chlorophyti TaxID=708187 RepID=A0A1Q8RU15_9PEZI|nr:Chromosome transmission fidelity protein 18 [Colletotrichum chlorophyti]
MPSASSPIAFPTSPPPPAAKRVRPTAANQTRSKPKVKSGFLLDDDDSEGDDEPQKPPLKKHILDFGARLPRPAPVTTIPDDNVLVSPTVAPVRNLNQSLTNLTQPPAPGSSHGLAATLLSSTASIFKTPRTYSLTTCDGTSTTIKQRKPTTNTSYESIVAARSKTKEGRAKRAYYGIDINELIDLAKAESSKPSEPQRKESDVPVRSVEPPLNGKQPRKTLLWTEKYRAKNFLDLCGDDSTNRMVLRWLKRWDPIVFPGVAKKVPIVRRPGAKQTQEEEEKPHKKILMLAGPPGLGKTTLAHVCARQAGYDVMEINASDDRSRDVVKNRIRTSLGTESVKTVENRKTKDGEQQQKVARPACVIVDEVDGVVSGAGASGEGGFVKALIDLILLDQKNTPGATSTSNRKKKKGDDFRLMRPLILICNDVYHNSLRPLRQSGMAEIIHVGKPSIDAVVTRLKTVFDKEGIPCEKDAARKICEAAWGMTSGIDAKRGAESGAEGDLRGVMVVGEWVAGRFKAAASFNDRLTRQWLDKHLLHDLTNGAGGSRGLGRGSTKDIVTRVFLEGGGFPKQALDTSQNFKNKHEQPKSQLGFAEYQKKNAMERLRHMIDTSGEVDRIMTDVFLEYPNREFNDDSFLSKPNEAYEWMNFLDTCSSRTFGSQEWELAPYLSQPILACHSLFASPRKHQVNAGYDKKWGGDGGDENEAPPVPFSGPRADFAAHEAQKQNKAMLQAIQAQLNPTLGRSFRSVEDIATEFMPYLVRMISPDVKPVVIGGSGLSTASVRKETEKAMVKRAAETMVEVGIVMQKGKIESDSMLNRTPQWVYRMEPDIDGLAIYETAGNLLLSNQAPTRYAVRQVLDQEMQKTIALRESAARQARFKAGNPLGHEEVPVQVEKEDIIKEQEKLLEAAVKRDFFGRIVPARPLGEVDPNGVSKRQRKREPEGKSDNKVWVTYHEGLNNAVRKPITLKEFMRGL